MLSSDLPNYIYDLNVASFIPFVSKKQKLTNTRGVMMGT